MRGNKAAGQGGTHGDVSLGFVSLHLFVLREFDCGGGLIFDRAAAISF
jgi:hypothetical protein